MSLSSVNKTLQLLTRLLDTEHPTEPMADFGVQKPALTCGRSGSPLPRCTPEWQGVPSTLICQFLQSLRDEPTLRMHNVMIVRNGHVLCQAPFGAQDPELPRMTFSACKSVVALAVGLLMDDGLLHPEDKLTELFDRDCGPVSRRLMKDLTVSHLLSMQTGNLFNEGGSMTTTQWTESFFSSPGLDLSRKFQYNSLNTYILAVLVTRLTGRSLTDFLTQRLFDPMGIGDFYWEKSPEGVEKGGWGLYMRPEDLAKLGQLVMDEGCWEGRQLLSREFLEQALSTHARTPEHCGSFNYGWQIWVGREDNTFLFNGMLGQNVLGSRDSGILVISHGGNDETFQTSAYFPLVLQAFGGDFPHRLPRDPAGERLLRRTLQSLAAKPEKLPSRAQFLAFSGKRFVTDEPQAASMGLFPLVLQAAENCYSKGFCALSLGGSRTAPELFYEERGQLHHLVIGMKAPCKQTLSLGGNTFLAAVQGRFTRDEEENPVLRIRIDFTETPCTKILKLVLTRQGALLRQEELPGADFVSEALSTQLQSAAARALLTALLGSGDPDFIRWRIRQLLAPTIPLAPEE